MFTISFLRMRNVVVLAALVFMFLGMEVLLLSVVYIPEAGATIPVTQIFHESVLSFWEGSSLPIEVAVKDPAGVTGVRCYFRFDSSLPFVYSEMVGAKDNVFTTKLPIALSTVQKIEYLFLVVNGQKQAILSPTFTVNKKQKSSIVSTEAQNPASGHYQLKSEVNETETVKDFFLQPDNVQISLVPQQDHYGVLAGLYSREQIGAEVAAGYFGSFRLDPKKGMVAVKGYFVIRRSGDFSSLQGKSAVAKEAVVGEPVPVEPVLAPDISGDGWTGYFWRSDLFAFNGSKIPITATVTQTADGKVTITTSLKGLGHYFEGDIDVTGQMLVYDAYDNEDWSTHDGPATDVSIEIEDYVVTPSLEHPDPPLNIIKLTRNPKPKLPFGVISLLLSGAR